MTDPVPSISVVIPAWRAEATIADALRSVAEQTVQPVETIVVDDASGDDTAGRAEAALPSATVLRLEQNGGPAVARNVGWRHARGEWIAFLDADDAWLPWRLEHQLEGIRAWPPAALWCGRTVAWDEELKLGDRVTGARPAAKQLPLESFINNNAVATSTVLVRRDVLESLGGFDESFRGPEDYDLWIRIAAKHALMRLQRPLARYRSRPGSLSMDDRTFLPQVLGVLEKAFAPDGALAAYDYLRAAGISNQLWNASWMAFRRGARMTAVTLWARAYWMNLISPRRRNRRWFSLLTRYLFGFNGR